MTKVNSLQQLFSIIQNKDINVIKFYATWCVPCKMLAPIILQVEKENPDVKFYEIDIDELPEATKNFNVLSVPTTITMNKGKIVDNTTGVRPPEHWLKILQSIKK